MWSAESIAAVKVAAVICNANDLKNEILCGSGSEYSRKVKDSETFDNERAVGKCTAKWNHIIEKRTAGMLKYLQVPETLYEKIIGCVLSIGKQMLIWATHHERIIETSRECSTGILNISFITQRGTIENKKVAEKLMNDRNLNIIQKYKLATRYCLIDHIPVLYGQISENEKKILSEESAIRELSITKFWTSYLSGGFYKLSRHVDWAMRTVEYRALERYVLELAIADGCLPTIQKFFERIIVRYGNDIVVEAAVKAVEAVQNTYKEEYALFRSPLATGWIPNNNYIDILCFLLSKMTEDQQKEFLRKDIEGTGKRRSRVLECFLKSPYQNYFLKTAERMWQFLPENNFAALLTGIVKNIEQVPEKFAYGESKCFDYRKLLREFWSVSPERFKKSFVLSNEEIVYRYGREYHFTAVTTLLIAFLELHTFTAEDREVFQLILASAIDADKIFILCSKEWIQLCCSLIREKRWDMLNRLLLLCFSSKQEANTFRRHVSSTPMVMSICRDFVKYERHGALEPFIQWLDFSEEERLEWKRTLSFSVSESLAKIFVWNRDLDRLVEFLKWSSLPQQEARKLVREILLSSVRDGGVQVFRVLCFTQSLEAAREFCETHLSPEETMILEIRLVKRIFRRNRVKS